MKSKYDTKEILRNGTDPLNIPNGTYPVGKTQDTPKEWEEDIRREYGHMYIRNEDDEFCLVSNEIDWLIDEIKQLLDKARREYFSMGMEYFSLIDDSNIYQKKGWKLSEEKAERLQILDKIFNLLKDK